MGSKRWQLNNGLGSQLNRVVKPGDHVVDLFSGSGVVSHFAAETLVSGSAVDLQWFSTALAGAVVERTRKINVDSLVSGWLRPVRASLEFDSVTKESRRVLSRRFSAEGIRGLRALVLQDDRVFCRSYGGIFQSGTSINY